MKEILVWGDISEEFERIEIYPKIIYSGTGWSNDDSLSVYKISDYEFEELCKDSEENRDHWYSSDVNCAWRWSSGSNLGSVDKRFSVNGHWINAWGRNDYGQNKYLHLLDYIVSELNLSTEKNICAVTVDLARQNGMSLGELFKKYQG